MFSLFQIFISIILLLIAYFVSLWITVLNARKKIRAWVSFSARRVPFIGCLFEFGNSSNFVKNCLRLVNNPEKSTYLEVGFAWGILTTNYELTEFVLQSQSILRKGNQYKYLMPWLGEGLLTSSDKKWKSHRRVITPAFHFSILEQFVDVFDSNLNIMVEKLKCEALGKESVDIYKYVNICALDIICETAMGININAQNNENQEYSKAVKSMCALYSEISLSMWKRHYVLLRFFAPKKYQKLLKLVQILHDFTNSVIAKRRLEKQGNETVSTHDDVGRKRKMAFLDLLLSSTIDGQPLTQEEIRSEVDTFMFAGHDTTSSATSAAFYVLAERPEIQKRVRDELKTILGADRNRTITYRDLQELKYLDLVVKEVLRLYPPAPVIARKTQKDEDFKGNIIPKDTVVTICLYGINRDPDFHQDAEKFIPERFLEKGTRKPFSYVPFSAGPRNCIGQKFALLEFKMMVAKVLMYFEILPTNPPHQMEICSEVVLKSKNGVLVKLRECNWDEIVV